MVGHAYVSSLIRFNQIFKLTLRRLLIHLTCLAQSFYNRRSISLPLRPVSLVLFLRLLFFQSLNTICHCFHLININLDVSFINDIMESDSQDSTEIINEKVLQFRFCFTLLFNVFDVRKSLSQMSSKTENDNSLNFPVLLIKPH